MKNNLRIVAAQINTTVGDIENNVKKIITTILSARDQQSADIIIFPELVITGCPPYDLLFHKEFHQQIQRAINKIKAITGIYIIISLPIKEKNRLYNAAIIIYNKKIVASYHKHTLSNQIALNESYYFAPGNKNRTIKIKNTKIAITIGADLLNCNSNADLIINIAAHFFDFKKHQIHYQSLKQYAHKTNKAIIYVNSIGGQDELIFEGGSAMISKQGKIIQQAQFFEEELMLIETKPQSKKPKAIKPKKPEEMIYKALVLGVKDYVEKNGFKEIIMGISGGIDSSLTLAIAVDALGKNQVEVIYMPSRYSSKLSLQISKKQAKTLGVGYAIISIEPIFKTYLAGLAKKWKSLPQNHNDYTEQNLQARCRSAILMAFANKKNLLVLSTGNKSELACGYATLYGDLAGGFCVLKDIPKTLVYRLAKYRNSISKVIPQEALTRAPSAELAPNQKDSDTLPPYPILDEIIKRYLDGQSINKISRAGFSKKTIIKVIKMISKNEYKRHQAPAGIKISDRSFGCEPKYPITSKFSWR